MKYELEFMKMSAFFETPSYVCINYIAFQIALVCRFSSFSAEGNVMNLFSSCHISVMQKVPVQGCVLISL